MTANDNTEGLHSAIPAIYESVAERFDRDRDKSLRELPYLQQALLDHRPFTVLDVGCGSGDPIAKFFIDAGCDVTGVDTSRTMLAMCRARFPDHRWIEADMRSLALHEQFDSIVAWD